MTSFTSALKALVVSVALVVCVPLSAFASDLSATKHAVGTGVSGKEVTGEATTFTAGQKVYGLFLVVNTGAPVGAKIVWKHDDVVKGTLEVTIGTSKTGWRTYGQHQLSRKAPGAWACELLAEDGSVVASSAFTVSPRS